MTVKLSTYMLIIIFLANNKIQSKTIINYKLLPRNIFIDIKL